MFSITCFQKSTCLTNIKFRTVVTFKFVYTCGCVFYIFGVVCGFVCGESLEGFFFVVYTVLYSSFF